MKFEEAAYTYMSNVTNKLLKNAIKADTTYEDVKDIDLEEIKKWKNNYYIAGVILDIDGTVRENMENVDYRNIKWIMKLKQELKVCMVSNGIDNRIKELAEKMGIEYISLAFKPLKKGFLTAVKQMKLEPENVLVIGDGYLADIFGGKRLGMRTAIIQERDER